MVFNERVRKCSNGGRRCWEICLIYRIRQSVFNDDADSQRACWDFWAFLGNLHRSTGRCSPPIYRSLIDLVSSEENDPRIGNSLMDPLESFSHLPIVDCVIYFGLGIFYTFCNATLAVISRRLHANLLYFRWLFCCWWCSNQNPISCSKSFANARRKFN